MPNKHAAQKDLRKNRRHAKANLRIKTNVKSLFAKTASFVKEGKKSDALASAKAFQQAIDKAAKQNIFSYNASRRRKAALMKMVNAVQA